MTEFDALLRCGLPSLPALAETVGELGQLVKRAGKLAATGIPERKNLGDLSQLQPGQLLDFIIQQHNAQRAGLHNDVRFGNPQLGLYSWATRKELPEPGKKIGIYQTPLHAHSYGNFQGTLSGYGAGTVRRKRKGQIKLVQVAPGRIEFQTVDDDPVQQFALHQNAKRPANWLLRNTTPLPDGIKLAGDRWLKEAADEEKVPTVAVDLDGTLAQNLPEFDPDKIGEPRRSARKWLKRFRRAGARIIIFTVRGNRELVKDWLVQHKMPFSYINENPDQPEDASGKVLADVYWDDRAESAAGALDGSGPRVLQKLKAAEDIPVLQHPAAVLELIWAMHDIL